MLRIGELVPPVALQTLDGSAVEEGRRAGIVAFISVDCPTCRLTLPYLDKLSSLLHGSGSDVVVISQSSKRDTERLQQAFDVRVPLALDAGLQLSRAFDLVTVPTVFRVDAMGALQETMVGFDKEALNRLASGLLVAAGRDAAEIAPPYDGAPARKPGCGSKHLEPDGDDDGESEWLDVALTSEHSRIEVPDGTDLVEYCREAFGDPLPVVPPTESRVEAMRTGARLAPEQVIAAVPPNYGRATVKRIAANAVMAGCRPEYLGVLIAAVRAICDERFNLHGVVATTNYVAPLLVINGPIRRALGFACGSNVFSNVAHANSTIGRALQLIIRNLGGARAGEIDMSTLGNPGKFSFCIAEHEEVSPWAPYHVDRGFRADQSVVSVVAAEPMRGVSEHNARDGAVVLDAIAAVLATIWNYRECRKLSGLVVLCPEHARTIHGSGFSKADARQYLFEHSVIPQAWYRDDGGEGTRTDWSDRAVVVKGLPCYRKFETADDISIVVTGGTAGKFSGVLGSWRTGPTGTESVSYPIED